VSSGPWLVEGRKGESAGLMAEARTKGKGA